MARTASSRPGVWCKERRVGAGVGRPARESRSLSSSTGAAFPSVSSARARYRAIPVDVGWSKTAVVCSFTPVADLEPIPELDRTQRIETQLLELLVRTQGVAGVVP